MISFINNFYYQAANRGSEVFLYQFNENNEVKEYTFSEVLSASRKIANYLKSKYREGSHIGLLGKMSANWLIFDLAIFTAHMVSVPIPARSPMETREIIDHAKIVAIFMENIDDADFFQILPENIEVISSKLPIHYTPLASIVLNTKELEILPQPSPSQMASIMYSHNATHPPKGAIFNYQALTEVALRLKEFYRFDKKDRVFCFNSYPLPFMRSHLELAGLVSGFKLYFAEQEENFLNNLKFIKPTILISPHWLNLKHQISSGFKEEHFYQKINIVKNYLINKHLKNIGLNKLRLALHGGSYIPGQVVDWYKQLKINLWETYGMSENLGYSHISRPGRVGEGLYGAPGVRQRLTNEGELEIKGPGNFVGYYNYSLANSLYYTNDQYFKTGDMGYYDSNGKFYLTGRIKNTSFI